MNPIEEKKQDKKTKFDKKLSFTMGEEIEFDSEPEEIDEEPEEEINESFRDFFFSTVKRAFTDEYTRCLNYEDAITVLSEAYILMYQQIDSLHHAPSAQWWVRKNRDTAYNSCVRRKKLSNIYESEEGESFPEISDDDVYELWKRIKKVGSINTFVLMPKPMGSLKTIDSVKHYIRSISPQRAITIVTVLGISVFVALLGAVFYAKVLPLFVDKDAASYLEEKEIYLEPEFFEQFDMTTVDVDIDQDLMNEIMDDAAVRAEEKIAEDEREAELLAESQAQASEPESTTSVNLKDYEFFSRDPKDNVTTTTTTTVKFIAQEVEGEGSRNTAANAPEYTGDQWLDKEVKNVVTLLLKDSMSDSEKLGALYEYICKYGSYGTCDREFENYIQRAKYFFKYRTGTSQEYAAAYYALCSAVGYKCKIVNGYFVVEKGSKTYYYEHSWCKITLNGIEYYFDPEADSNQNGSKVDKHFFFVTRDNSRWKLFTQTHKWAEE
ncbi:MAG: transglutaminase domain-containing protein [Clostridia bacterium]|nr:transglutaminase domain-containing protein [Clostridia bacterium]